MLLQNSKEALLYYALTEAQADADIFIPIEVEQYLISLLINSIDNQELLQEPVAIEFLQGFQPDISSTNQQIKLKSVGDQCLILVGLFPERTQRRNVSIKYYHNMGQTAYSLLSNPDPDYKCIFKSLTNKFRDLSLILSNLRKTPDINIPI